MADDDDRDSRTEEPTEKRLRDALDRGDGPLAREPQLLASLAGALAGAALFAPAAAADLGLALATLLDGADRWRIASGADAAALLTALAPACLRALAPPLLTIVVLALAAHAGQGALRAVVARLAPKAARISPGAGLKRIVGAGALAEHGRTLVKLLGFGVVLSVAFATLREGFVASATGDPGALPGQALTLSLRLVGAASLAAAVVVGLDVALTRRSWLRKLRMTRQEVRNEHKDTEGDPLIRTRQRRIAMSRARQRMILAVPRATLVVANPTHYAVALRYAPGVTAAPVVVARGADRVALRIRALAEAEGIPVVEDKALARALYDQTRVDQLIPAAFYAAVAKIIHTLSARSVGAAGAP